MRNHRVSQSYTNILWPGFIDALSTLLLVVIFLLMIFFLGQFFLQVTITGQSEVIDQTSLELHETRQTLNDTKEALESIRNQLQDKTTLLADTEQITKRQKVQITDQLSKITQLQNRKEELELKINQIKTERNNLENEVKRFSTESLKKSHALDVLQEEILVSRTRLKQLIDKYKKLEEQNIMLTNNLEITQSTFEENKKIVEDLTHQLNIVLSDKVATLAKYRSEFFGRLQEILGDTYQNIRISGDRFIFSSEVLFSSGSADLEIEGKKQLEKVSLILKEIAIKIPKDIPWILRVDGHTDALPIASQQYPSNWELSQARALSVVKYFESQGIPSEKLAAAGFGEFHPIDEKNLKPNRRIELKITEK